MRTTQLIGGILALTALALAPAALAQQGPGGGSNSNSGRDDAKPRGGDSLKDRLERGIALPGQLREQGDAIRAAVEQRRKELELDIEKKGQIRAKTEGRGGGIDEIAPEARLGNSGPGKRIDFKGPPLGENAATGTDDKGGMRARLNEEMNRRMQGTREAFQLKAEALREDFKQRIEMRREEIKGIIETRKEELKAKLGTFKDGVKKEVAARIDGSLGSINERWIAGFTASVNRMDGGLAAIASRVDKAEAAGKDVTGVRDAIDAAEEAIADARAAIEAQASKDYTLEIGDETTVKADATATRDELKTDLTTVREAVRAALDATKEAAQALRAIPGIGTETQVETTTSNQ